jgi:hypothetical protein
LELLDRFPALFGLPDDPNLSAVYAFLTANSDLVRVRGSVGVSLTSFDPDVATSPRGVFVTGVQLVGASGVSYEGAPTPLLDRVIDFLSVARGEASQNLTGVYCPPLDFHISLTILWVKKLMALFPLVVSAVGPCCDLVHNRFLLSFRNHLRLICFTSY